jgi:hypothetical protein
VHTSVSQIKWLEFGLIPGTGGSKYWAWSLDLVLGLAWSRSACYARNRKDGSGEERLLFEAITPAAIP